MRTVSALASLAILLTLPLVCAAQGAPTSTPAEPWFTVSITAPEAVVTVGSDVKLKVVFVNRTDKDIHYAGAGGSARNGPAFETDIRDSEGKAVSETRQGLKLHGKDPHPWAGSVFAATAHPGEKIEEQLLLNDEYDLNKPGKYTIQVRERNPKFEAVRSNTISITVVP